ncbi:class I SAM-dependent DNA methyltransferase [Pseudogracilibacillus sp. ICA-222130]|uniref:class I SAM-dependent DNA methyltransferase n=1 Tax=Pseudogracilibacillus sp. ICA-222130 TaxID=3134655 RepID=UPI0030BE65A3
MTYNEFAYVYDRLMEHAPYDSWVQFTKDMIESNQLKTKNIVDLGCGTGEIAIRLANSGFHITGVDISSDMLTVAQAKAMQQGVHIPWIHQDMTNLEGFSNTDLFISYCDVMNYITNIDEVTTVCQRVYEHLQEDGAFIFDIHALPYVEKMLVDQTFADVTDELAYIWFCESGEEIGAMTHYLTIFEKQVDGTYHRFDEIHEEKTYNIETYANVLHNIGFRKIKFYADFSMQNEISTDKGERIFIFAQK